jgi:hypothetical protein
MFSVGSLRPVESPTPEPGRHSFARASTIALADEKLGHRSFRVLLALECYCFGDDRESWATNRTIGKRAGGIGPEAVRQGLRQLEQLGYIRLIEDKTRWRGSRIEILYGFVQAIEKITEE